MRQEPGSWDFNISNIDKVDGIYLATSRGLLWGKLEPPDYLFHNSIIARGITYKTSLGYVCQV